MLPYANFAISAMVLSDELLLSSLDEARKLQLRMQSGSPDALWGSNTLPLMLWGDCLCRELKRRGIETKHRVLLAYHEGSEIFPLPGYTAPPWLGNPEFHQTQQDRLTEIDPAWRDRRPLYLTMEIQT